MFHQLISSLAISIYDDPPPFLLVTDIFKVFICFEYFSFISFVLHIISSKFVVYLSISFMVTFAKILNLSVIKFTKHLSFQSCLKNLSVNQEPRLSKLKKSKYGILHFYGLRKFFIFLKSCIKNKD